MTKEQRCLIYVLPHVNLDQLVEKDDLEKTSMVFFNEPICNYFGIDVFTVMHFN